MTRRRLSPIAAIAALLLAATTTACSGAGAETPDPPRPSTSSTAPSTSPPPTPEEVAAEAALAVYEAAFELDDRIAQAPGSSEWGPQIREYSTGEAATKAVEAVDLYRELGIRQEGPASIDPEVTAVDLAASPPTVAIRACYDDTTSDLVYAQTGVPIPQDPNELPRWWIQVTVIQVPTGQWLVSSIEPQTEQAC